MAELVANLALARGDLAIDVALSCPPGITALMGPSGAGKSTILAMLAGLVAPERGRVAIGDTVWFSSGQRPLDVESASRPRPASRGGPGDPWGTSPKGFDSAVPIDVPVHERALAFVFQKLALFPHMTALGNVMYGMHGVPRADRPAKALAALAELGVGHLAERRPRTFSGGEAQRVALARALARSPKLVLLDEPFSALDRALRAQLCELVASLVGRLGVPAVHVTHSAAEARAIADRVIRIEHGRVAAAGTPAELLAGE